MFFPIILLAFTAIAAGKTDLSGCTSSDVIAYGGASVLWYVPGTGEICSFLDCGGGMAPPMTTVPGCPLYSGTATYSPSFLPGFKDGSAAAVSSTSYVAATSSSPFTAMVTGSSTADGALGRTTLPGAASTSRPASPDSLSTKPVKSTGTTTESKPRASATTQSSSTTRSASSASSAASSSSTSNAGVSISTGLLTHDIIGAIAAGSAFLL